MAVKKVVRKVVKKGVPLKDGSGHGQRANKGRGGCETPRKTGKGRES